MFCDFFSLAILSCLGTGMEKELDNSYWGFAGLMWWKYSIARQLRYWQKYFWNNESWNEVNSGGKWGKERKRWLNSRKQRDWHTTSADEVEWRPQGTQPSMSNTEEFETKKVGWELMIVVIEVVTWRRDWIEWRRIWKRPSCRKLKTLDGSFGHLCRHWDHSAFQQGLDKDQLWGWMPKPLIKERE